MTYLGFSNEYKVIDMIETYYDAGASDKALDLARRSIDEIFVSTEFFLNYYDFAKKEFESCYNCISYIADLTDHFGNSDFANEVRNRFNTLLDIEE